jgi:hypothetical protein
MKFGPFYPVTIARSDRLGSGLLGLDRGLYQNFLQERARAGSVRR